MKTLFFYITLFCLSLVSLVSCVSKKPTDPVIVTKIKTVTETVKDTVFTTKADSSFYKAFVDCRDGKPILITDNFPSGEKSEVVKKGNYVQPPKVNLSQDGVLTVDCKAEAQKLFASWKNTYINEQEPVIVPSTIRLYDESLAPWYVKVQIWAGRILLLLIGIGLIIEAYNLIKRK